MLGEFNLDASFRSESIVTALSGPSGSGKSSIVAAIAGLLTPKRGRIAVNGRTLFDSEARIGIPAQKRGMRVVFQESRLFPHFTVAQNLMFGRWLAGKKRRRTQERDHPVSHAAGRECEDSGALRQPLPRRDRTARADHREDRRWKGHRDRKTPLTAPTLNPPRTGEGSERVGQAIFTKSLPKFLPFKRPMKASGAFSRPFTTSSRYLMRPSRTHWPASR